MTKAERTGEDSITGSSSSSTRCTPTTPFGVLHDEQNDIRSETADDQDQPGLSLISHSPHSVQQNHETRRGKFELDDETRDKNKSSEFLFRFVVNSLPAVFPLLLLGSILFAVFENNL